MRAAMESVAGMCQCPTVIYGHAYRDVVVDVSSPQVVYLNQIGETGTIRQRLFMKGDSNMKTVLKGIIRRLLASRGWVIVDANAGNSKLGYIAAKETIAAARREGLSICDFVEKMWQIEGDTAKVIDEMDQHGSFAVKNPRVVEIGAGTGRYLEKVLEKTDPKSYESYETAVDWADYLQAEFGVISHEADGCSLR